MGSALSDGGYNIQTEYGRQINWMEIGGNLNFYSDLPIKSYDAYSYEQVYGFYFNSDNIVNGLSMLSIDLTANVDVFYFIENLKNKHMLRIGGGIGGYTFWNPSVNPGNDGYVKQVGFNSDYGFQYSLSAKYEYAITKNIALGVYYDYLKSVDDYHILGFSAKRYF